MLFTYKKDNSEISPERDIDEDWYEAVTSFISKLQELDKNKYKFDEGSSKDHFADGCDTICLFMCGGWMTPITTHIKECHVTIHDETAIKIFREELAKNNLQNLITIN